MLVCYASCQIVHWASDRLLSLLFAMKSVISLLYWRDLSFTDSHL
jgi:hypothetical protein